MSLTEEEIEELKAQLSEQIQHLPEPQKQQAQEQIDNMSPEAIESMLKQQTSKGKGGSDEVFRLIVSGQIPSRKLAENKFAIAVLDIRPVSKGHTLIIPKTPVTKSGKLPTQCFTLAKQLSKKIVSKLKAKSTEILTESKFKETILNVIPIYTEPVHLGSPRMEMKEEELAKIQSQIEIKKKPKAIKLDKPKAKITETAIQLKRRIP